MKLIDAAKELLAMIDAVGPPEEPQADRVFAQFEFDNLRAAVAELNTVREHLHIVHRHVKEALELLGVDVSVDGYIPDSWTLREQCKIAGDKLRRGIQ